MLKVFKDNKMKSHIKTAEIILSALPYIQKFRGQVFVIKYGGAAQTDEGLKNDFARDIVLLQLVGIKVVIVHGGGKKINSLLDKLNIESHFEDGLRVTNKDTMEVVEMALSGLINKEITSLLVAHGARAVGISGKDDGLLRASAFNLEKYGFVGKIDAVNEAVINALLKEDIIPVIAPIALGENATSYNINADLAASAIAAKLRAKSSDKFTILLTFVPGFGETSYLVIVGPKVARQLSISILKFLRVSFTAALLFCSLYPFFDPL